MIIIFYKIVSLINLIYLLNTNETTRETNDKLKYRDPQYHMH